MQQKYFKSQHIPNIPRPVGPQRAPKNIRRDNEKLASHMRYMGKRFFFHTDFPSTKQEEKSKHLIKSKMEKSLLSTFYRILIKDIHFQKVVGTNTVYLFCCISRSLPGFPGWLYYPAWNSTLSSECPCSLNLPYFWLQVPMVNKRALFTGIFIYYSIATFL